MCGVTAGDDERRRLIEAHLPVVGRLAARLAGRGERVDDLTQVGALAVVRAVDRRDPARGELGAYVARCAEGEMRRHLRDRASVVRLPRRAQQTGARVAAVPLAEEELEAPGDLDDLLVQRVLVWNGARALDDRERLIVLLRFFCDLTQEDIAAELDLSQAHVSRLLARAMTKMRRELETGALSNAS
jgi:RNA polymerase sigma-B factor